MNPKIIYPIPARQNMFYKRMRVFAFISFISASLICVLLNIILKGKPWCLIVLWSLYSIWQLVFSLKLVEYSIFSHIISIFIHVIVLLWIIDTFIAPGWAATVIPIVFFAAMLIMFIFYFATYNRKQRHLVSIMFLGICSIASIPLFTNTWPIENWIAFIFQIASALLFIVLVIINWKDILFELKVRFKTKNR